MSDLREPRKPCWQLWPLQPCERLQLLGKRQARARRRAMTRALLILTLLVLPRDPRPEPFPRLPAMEVWTWK